MAQDRKTCPDCGENKPTIMFGLNKTQPDGLQYYCRACKSKRNREVNAKRRWKIRQWEADHATECVDCGWKVSYNGVRRNTRCVECARAHQRRETIARAKQALALRAEGKLNYEIAPLIGVSTQGVAQLLSRRRLRELGLLNERVESPYYTKRAA